MEPGVIPSFKFPSRHNNVNYAQGWTNWSTVNETVMVKPAKNTDISLETALENVLTQPPITGQYRLDYKGVVPASSNLYVQPGRAEGVTELAKLMNSEVKITEITSANNALRRGNRLAAENVLGRELTTEEISNQTVTPEARKSENGELARHVPVHDAAMHSAVGSQFSSTAFNHHNRVEMVKQAERGALNEMAAHLGVPVPFMRHLKTIMGYSGDTILGWKAFSPLEKKVIFDQLKTEINRNWNGALYGFAKNDGKPSIEGYAANVPPASIIAGQNRPLHSGDEARTEANRYRELLRAINGVVSDDINMEGVVPGLRHANQNETRGVSDNTAGQLGERRAGGPPDPNTGERVLTTQAIHVTQDFVPIDQVGLTMAVDAEAGRRPELQVPNVPDVIAEAVHRPEIRLQEELALEAETESFDAPTRRRGVTDEDLADILSGRWHADPRAPPPQATRARGASAVGEAKAEHKADEKSDAEEALRNISGGGLTPGRPTRNFKRKRFLPKSQYTDISDRWVPQTDSIEPRGGVASGMLMKATGHNAIPISAQVQVANHHQWNETPLLEWIKNPNSSEVIKTYHSDIPVPQATGRGTRSSKKVKLGGYMLDHNKLLNSHILSIAHPSGRKVKGFPNQEVSAGMKSAIHNIVTGGHVNTKRLRADERLKLHSLLSKSAATVHGADVNVSPSEQLKLAMGEMEAGNDSPALKLQIKRLLPILRRSNLITAGQVEDISKHYL